MGFSYFLNKLMVVLKKFKHKTKITKKITNNSEAVMEESFVLDVYKRYCTMFEPGEEDVCRAFLFFHSETLNFYASCQELSSATRFATIDSELTPDIMGGEAFRLFMNATAWDTIFESRSQNDNALKAGAGCTYRSRHHPDHHQWTNATGQLLVKCYQMCGSEKFIDIIKRFNLDQLEHSLIALERYRSLCERKDHLAEITELIPDLWVLLYQYAYIPAICRARRHYMNKCKRWECCSTEHDLDNFHLLSRYLQQKMNLFPDMFVDEIAREFVDEIQYTERSPSLFTQAEQFDSPAIGLPAQAAGQATSPETRPYSPFDKGLGSFVLERRCF